MRPVSKQSKSGRKSGKHGVAKRAGPSSRNDYLSSLLDPFNAKGIGIPDFDTAKVLTVTTVNRYPVTSDSGGRRVIIFRPGNAGGIMTPGMQTADGNNLHSMLNSSANKGGGTTGAGVTNLLKANDLTLFQNDFEQVRPVSMGLKWVPTQNATTMQGLIYVVDHIPGDCFPVPLSSATAAAGGIEQATGSLLSAQNVAAFTNMSDIEASADHINHISKELVSSWTPDLPDNIMWRRIGENAGQSDFSGTYQYKWLNTTLGGDDDYIVPGHYSGIGNSTTKTFTSIANVERLDDDPFASIIWAFDGCTVSAALGDVEIVVNWEVQVRPGLSSIMPTRVVPSNPDEFAQASNIIQQVPRSYYPGDPNEPTTQLMPHIRGAATHLYDGTPKKQAVEGTSLWSKIKSVGGKLLGAATPFLSMIPGAGPVLGAGASFLSSIMN